MKNVAPSLINVIFMLFASAAFAQEAAMLPAPPQDKGLPYTRSAREFGLAKIKDTVAVFEGSRYGYVKGYKVRLDQGDLRHGEAVLKDGQLYVPAAFAGVLDLKEVKPDPAPVYLADRWVYSLSLPNVEPPGAIQIDGKAYVPLAKLAEAKGLKVSRNPSGLLLIGDKEVTFADSEASLLETVITLFDTPEKFAVPDIATKYIPTLARQGKWTEHVKVTPEQLALLNGPETKWPTAPKSEYDYSGFNDKLLGSKVPPPGVYPRVLFSPEDVPMLAARVKSTKAGQEALVEMEYLFKKSWWDPSTSDGQIFEKLAKGDVAGLDWDVPPDTSPASYPAMFKGQKPGIFSSHIAYIPECLTAMALYCLLTDDDEHGRKAGAAIANYYKMREPLLDEINAISDSEFGSTYTRPNGAVVPMNGSGAATHWRTMQGAAAHMNMGLSLDFGGKWMTPDQKDSMRRFIAKATYGRRPYGQDGSVRFRDVNWVAWDLPPFLGLAAIEGLEGFDPEAYESDCETVRAWCDWGLDDAGVVYESNGKTPGSLEFESLSMVALARRGENLWGHPHWRKFLSGQIQMTSPTGRVTVNSGTQYTPYSRQALSFQFVDTMKAFYPQDRRPDYLLDRAKIFSALGEGESMREWDLDAFDPEAYRARVSTVQRLRLPSVTYPGFVHTVLYDADFQVTTRADLNLPLDFNDPIHGVFSSYSDRTPEAAWINILVRPDHYLGAGHHHADAGMVHFSGAGVDWFTQSPFHQKFDGRYFNLVQVDGHSEAEVSPSQTTAYNARAEYLGAQSTGIGAAGTADLTNAYSYRWLTQPAQEWPKAARTQGWEMDPSPWIAKMFAGTAREKMRFWWANYTYCNYIATSRALFNPMEHVFRTAGLMRGPHPYGFVVDDLKKDDATHLYQWVAMLNGGVWKADVPNLAANETALAFNEPPDGSSEVTPGKPPLVPHTGDPMLLICSLDQGGAANGPGLFSVETAESESDQKTKAQYYDRLLINQHSKEGRFKILLIPFHMGDELPNVAFDAATGVATLSWKDQSDKITFKVGEDARTRISVARGDATVFESM